MRCHRWIVAALIAALAGLVAATTPRDPGRGAPAVRLPDAEFGGDYWDLVARFDSGHHLFAQAAVTNMGLGDHKAAVFGFIVTPEGEEIPFRRTENRGGWRLSPDGSRMDLRSIVLDTAAPTRSLVVDKKEIEIDLAIEAAPSPAWEARPGDRCPVDVLDVASPVRGSYWLAETDERVELVGSATLTHRWMSGLEAECVQRRVEFFGLEAELGVYFSEVTTPEGAVHRWSVARRGDRLEMDRGAAQVELAWRGDVRGFPQPTAIDLEGTALALHVNVDEPVLVVEPLARVSEPWRGLLERLTRPLLRFSPAPFHHASSGEEAWHEGRGVVKVSYLNPLPSEVPSTAPANPVPGRDR